MFVSNAGPVFMFLNWSLMIILLFVKPRLASWTRKGVGGLSAHYQQILILKVKTWNGGVCPRWRAVRTCQQLWVHTLCLCGRVGFAGSVVLRLLKAKFSGVMWASGCRCVYTSITTVTLWGLNVLRVTRMTCCDPEMDKQKKVGWMDGKGLLLRELHDSVRAGITSILGTWVVRETRMSTCVVQQCI